MKKLNIKALATTGALLLLMVSGVSACGQQAQKSVSGSGPGAASQQGANYGDDEMQRAKSRLGLNPESDELQRWESRYPAMRH